MKRSKKDILDTCRKIAFAVDHAATRTGASRENDRLRDMIEANEKEHRAFGRRLVGAAAVGKGRMSVRDAIDYFVTRTIADAMGRKNPSMRPIADLRGMRGDYV